MQDKPRSSAGSPAGSSVDTIGSIAASVERRFREGRRVLSFAEYLDLFATDPVRFARDASRYVRDCFDHYGTVKVKHPWGEFRRFKLFDVPWEDAAVAPTGATGERRGALVGQEHVQEEIYRALSNFAREGRPNRLVLLHGPNGSAKSTIVGCVLRALENYSTLDEGALYRFHWIFPTGKTTRGALGFGQGGTAAAAKEMGSYAHLPDDQVDAKLLAEVRDHPLFLVPIDDRKRLLERLVEGKKLEEPFAEWILRGQLSHKNQQVFEALLSSYQGSYAEVLKHVQVERYFVSQRYRTGAVTIGPQMSVDAGERQITMDRSLGSLPPSLQAVTLYEVKGELVDAAGGVLEFSDLLKRPLDAFKYLQLTVETGEVALTAQNVQVNCVMMGSANELHLDAFREHPEFASFRGRLELVRTPYLRSSLHEQAIYDTHVAPQVKRHVAPHATRVAAEFAVLTRMRRPNPERFPGSLGGAVTGLTAFEKMDLYADATVPERLGPEVRKVLRAGIRELFDEADAYPVYEGRIGASPREMRVVLLDAAQSPAFRCLSPLAVLAEIEELCARRSEYEWLQEETQTGGYHDVGAFQDGIRERLLEAWEQELYVASGFVEEGRYDDLFERYVQHVSVWTKKERIRNKLTGEYEEPDENLMREVEGLVGTTGDSTDARQRLISTIAAWSLDHPGERVEARTVFPHLLRKLREAVFSSKRPQVAHLARDLVVLVRDEGAGLAPDRTRAAGEVLARLEQRFGYCDACATDMAAEVLRRRYRELVA